jgi:hypothetical protein
MSLQQAPKSKPTAPAPLRNRLKVVSPPVPPAAAPPAPPQPKPTPKPKPKPKPLPQPVAVAPPAPSPPPEASRPAPPRMVPRFDVASGERLPVPEMPGRAVLTATPQGQGDMPPGTPTCFGRLVLHAGRNGRPMVGLVIFCPCPRRLHVFPWRHDWGFSPDIVSLQPCPCWYRKGATLALRLHPEHMAWNEEVWLAATAAFDAWQAVGGRKAGWKRHRALQKAEQAARRKEEVKTDG